MPGMPSVVAPSPGGATPPANNGNQRTAIEAWGEELFASTGLPDEARTMTVDEAVALGKQIAVQEHLGVPKEATKGLTAEQITEEVGKLQALGAFDEIGNESFWKNHVEHGFDVAIAPHVRGNLGIPDGIGKNSPASKIMEDAGEIQNFGLDITNESHWGLFDQFQAGQKTPQDLIDVANASKGGAGRGTGKQRGSNSTPGANPGNGNNGSPGSRAATHPGNSSTDLPGKGGNAGATNSDDQQTPPGSQNDSRNGGTSSSGADMEGDAIIETVDPVSYNAVVTHNDDGSFTVDIYENDSSGSSTKVNSETYTDTDGDGSFTGDKGGSSSGKPAEGSSSADQDENGNYTWSAEDESSSDSSSSETDSADAGSDTSTDTETKPTDKYTPGPDGEAYHDFAWMLSTYQLLSSEKFRAGQGGKDSTPNPMADGTGNGQRPFNYKDTVIRPIDGLSGSKGNVPAEALNQIQDPYAVQGGVIDPVKNKDQ